SQQGAFPFFLLLWVVFQMENSTPVFPYAIALTFWMDHIDGIKMPVIQFARHEPDWERTRKKTYPVCPQHNSSCYCRTGGMSDLGNYFLGSFSWIVDRSDF
ncbi:MAG: hypothetical protein PVG14_12420, partial [Anaerolineales bacterium]